ELGDRPARAIIVDWIAAGCPAPEPEAVPAPTPVPAPTADVVTARTALAGVAAVRRTLPRRSRAAVVAAASTRRTHHSEAYVQEIRRRTADARPLSTEQRVAMRGRWYGPGGGAAH